MFERGTAACTRWRNRNRRRKSEKANEKQPSDKVPDRVGAGGARGKQCHPRKSGEGHPKTSQRIKTRPPSMMASALSRDTKSSRAARVRFSLHLKGSFLF